jgi:hypothetical protein
MQDGTLDPQIARTLLLKLGDYVRTQIIQARQAALGAEGVLSSISRESAADTIYEIDRVSEEAIQCWFAQNWTSKAPVELVMEGVIPNQPVTFPHGTPVERTLYKCLIDPVDGTRGIMYDKRPAWFLAGLAPQKGGLTRLSDIEIAVMVELPTTKQWRADRISAIRGRGTVADSVNVFTNETEPLLPRPSRAENVLHGFAYISRFFPTGKKLIAAIEEELWATLHPPALDRESIIFEDQYISTGGQFYEILAGHDRFIADIRPLVYAKLGIPSALCCHPYDVCSYLVLTELGIVVEHPLGGAMDGPFDTTSAISWVAYANDRLASRVRPVLKAILQKKLDERPGMG